MTPRSPHATVLLIGASRGLGLAMAEEYLTRGSQVVATVRSPQRTELHDLQNQTAGGLEIEHLDITIPEHLVDLHKRLASRTFDLLFVNAGIANNERGGFEVYRGTKAALNMFMRSYAARHHDDPRTLLLMAPGWVKTRLGGPNARLTIGESIPNLVKVIDAQHGRGGLQYLDYRGQTVAW